MGTYIDNLILNIWRETWSWRASRLQLLFILRSLMIQIMAFTYTTNIFLSMKFMGFFMKLKADVLTMTIEVSCLGTVTLCLDVTTINIVWIAIDAHCGVMVYWWSTENKMHIPVQYINKRQCLIWFEY